MQLGGEKEALEQVQLGPIVDDFNAFNLPFVFRSIDHMHKVVDGVIGQELLAGLEAGGLIGLGFMDAGARYSTTRKSRSGRQTILLASRSG